MDISAVALSVREQIAVAGPVLKFVFALLGGILSSFTPCVFPLLPIVAITIGASNTSGTRRQALSLSLTYGLGLAIVYAVLGLFAGIVGASLAAVASHPFAYILIAIFFSFFALMMFDIYTMPVPSAIIRAGASAQRKRGFFAVGVTGALSGLIAAPCLGPVVLFILTYIAKDGNPVTGFFMMFLYAVGVAFLPMLVGTFAGMASSLQKRQGAWMTAAKHAFGWFFILFALFYAFKAGQNYVGIADVRPGVMPAASANGDSAQHVDILGHVVSVESGKAPEKAGDRPLDIEYTYKGEVKKLSDTFVPGKVTLLTFWSTNCPLCIEEMPHLLQVYNKYKDRGFVVLSVNTKTNESQPIVEKFIKGHDMPYPVLFDEEHKIWDAYGLFGTPTNILMDGKGDIMYIDAPLPNNMEELVAKLVTPE